ncbi:VirB2 family type IV secretion system major pilin TrwL [Bartonella heixiaziensis]|uniref:VirB2 family type IV secretion system major pilin TrwL n=1 Tax=Bartonella heixiaziensis TaxID=1461000 RepID=UPI003D1B86FD
MKRLINLPSKNNNRIIAITAAIAVFLMDSPVYSQKALGNAEKALKGLQDELIDKIIPIAAAVILLCLAIGYAGRYIEKDTFVRWAIGVVIAGSAVQITKMLFSPN